MNEISSAKRSEMMAAVRSRNTKPELIVRRMLHALGFRFRLHRRDLPGTPDIVLPKYRTIVQVNGCFWHQHPGCKFAHVPASRPEYWEPKLHRNVTRDQENYEKLTNSGWHVIIVWECELRSPEDVARQLLSRIRPYSSPEFRETS